jgi:hypothetical protein
MEIDEGKIDDAVLALLWLTLHDERCAWKGFDWATTDRLHRKGLIGDPANKSKSLVLADEGLRRSEGSSNAAYRKKERMAVRRRFRVRTEADLFVSRSSRNAPMKGASKSRSVNCDGDLPRRVCANANRSLKVSR